MIPSGATELLLVTNAPLNLRKAGWFTLHLFAVQAVWRQTMTAIWCEWDEVTADEVVELLGRFLPAGEGRAERIAGEYVVLWSSKERPQKVYVGRSDRSFDEAYHRLIAKCAVQFLKRARARSHAMARPQPMART